MISGRLNPSMYPLRQELTIESAGRLLRGINVSANPIAVDHTLRAAGIKPGLLTLTIKDKSALYLAYMPFVKNGGVFVPSNSPYQLGDDVFMLLNLMGEHEKIPIAGRVIWVTPKGASGRRPAGIGVQFSDQDRGQAQKKIETLLAGALVGDKHTHTM
jgi:type IV pilus assembly protein PilZ